MCVGTYLVQTFYGRSLGYHLYREKERISLTNRFLISPHHTVFFQAEFVAGNFFVDIFLLFYCCTKEPHIVIDLSSGKMTIVIRTSFDFSAIPTAERETSESWVGN